MFLPIPDFKKSLSITAVRHDLPLTMKKMVSMAEFPTRVANYVTTCGKLLEEGAQS